MTEHGPRGFFKKIKGFVIRQNPARRQFEEGLGAIYNEARLKISGSGTKNETLQLIQETKLAAIRYAVASFNATISPDQIPTNEKKMEQMVSKALGRYRISGNEQDQQRYIDLRRLLEAFRESWREEPNNR